MPKAVKEKINLSNYTAIRANFSPKMRALLPSRAELVDSKTGELRVSDEVLKQLFNAIETYRNLPIGKKTQIKGETGLEQAFRKALTQDKTARKNVKVGILSHEEKAKIATAAILSKTLSPQGRKDLSTQASRLHDKDFYMVKYYAESGDYDIDKATDEMNESFIMNFSDLSDEKITQELFSKLMDWWEERNGETIDTPNKELLRKRQREALRVYTGANEIAEAADVVNMAYSGGYISDIGGMF